MRVAKIIAPRRIEIFDEPIPELDKGKVLVRLEKAAICGSDLPYFRDKHPDSAYPFASGYSGHECVGVVESSDSLDYNKGDFVLTLPPYLDGFKEYYLVTPDRLMHMPRQKDTSVMLMTQLLGAVVHCCRRINNVWGMNTVVIGQGPVGLLFNSMLKNMGATRVIGVDILDYRLRIAKEMGATHTIDSSKQNVSEIVKDITKGNMADLVVEACGYEETLNMSFDLARHDGVVAFFGICLKESPGLNFNQLFRKELRIIASVGPSIEIDYAYALRTIMADQIEVERLITHTLPFVNIQEGFEIAVNRKEEVIKVILEF
jgi:L-iditol 2-dehydrogenase